MIESPLLPKTKAYISGRWVDSASGERFAVINPATGEHLAEVPSLNALQTQEAVRAGVEALNNQTSASRRCEWLTGVAEALIENKQELGRIITSEHGKPHKEAVTEVEYSAGFFRFFAAALGRLKPEILPERPRDLTWTIHHRPAGVAALITPWNFPLAMLAKKLAPALGAGCSVITKPASQTPLSAIALYTLLARIGLPPGTVNLVSGSSGPIGRVLCSEPAVRVISFTGSTEVGKILAQQAAPHLKRLALELGGNAPFIIFEDADIDWAADALLANKFRAGGQTCVCANRVYVHDTIVNRFSESVAERTRRLRVGNGILPETDIGPLINREGFDKVASHVKNALDRGARRLVGGDPLRPGTEWGAFYPPTVLSNVTAEMLVCREETFGPVIAISSFASEAEVVAAANNTPYGLAAYVFTASRERAERVIGQLHFGHVGLNTGTGPAPEAPFGGMKESGFGREGGMEGLLEFCETQVVAGS